jgi:hypothetical protein
VRAAPPEERLCAKPAVPETVRAIEKPSLHAPTA